MIASVFDFAARLGRARAMMADRSVTAMLLSVGSDLPYFTGYEAPQSERLTMAIITDDAAVVVVPRLEAMRIESGGDSVSVVAWDETDDPIAAVAAALPAAPGRLAVGDQTWAVFLLGLQASLPHAEFVSATPITRELRKRKSAAEVDYLRRAAAAADRVAERLGDHRFSGCTEQEVATTISDMLVEEGHQIGKFAIVAAGPNGASPHHEPSERIIGEGDQIVVDFGGRLGGYHSDTTRCFSVGRPDDDYTDAYAVLRRAQDAAVAAVSPGVAASAIDRTARDIIATAGYGDYFVHRTGHGIGLDVHEDPYLVAGNDETLEPGMTFSVEPGIYVPGRWGMRIEDVVVVTDEGSERLNESTRELVVVE